MLPHSLPWANPPTWPAGFTTETGTAAGIPVSTAPAVQVGLCQLLLLLHQAVSATRARAGLPPSTPLYSDTLQPTDPAAVAQLLADSMAQYRAHKYNILAVQI